MKLTVNLEKDSYPIYIENNILSQAGDYIRKIYHGKRIMIISDDNVFPLYGDRLIHTLDSTYECHHLVLPHGESTKDFQTAIHSQTVHELIPFPHIRQFHLNLHMK